MKTYETLFIIHPELEDSEVVKTIDSIQEIITTGGGTILKVDKWGMRQLSYMIQNKREGYYVLMYFEAPPTLITELHRRYKLTDAIMRYQVVQPNKTQIEEALQDDGVTEESEMTADNEFEENHNAALEADEELVASTEG